MFDSNLKNASNFHQLEVVGRGSEIQFEVGETLNTITWWETEFLKCVVTSHFMGRGPWCSG